MAFWNLGIGSCETPAAKIYRKRVLTVMSVYIVLVFGAALLVKHGQLHGTLLYCISLAPAVPVIAVFVFMAIYLRDEKDEFMRMLNIWAMLAGTGALMSTVVVADFLRMFAHVGAPPPMVYFMVFFLAYGITHSALRLWSRGGGDE